MTNTMTTSQMAPRGPAGRIRSFLMALFLLGATGTAAELLLLGHTEDPWQWVPLVLMAVGVVAACSFFLRRDRGSLRAFQVTMGVFLVSGIIGLVLHYRVNVEFELEMYASLGGLDLFWEAMQGATPVLAPGMMIELGLLGLAYAFRHPIFTQASDP